MNFNEMLFDEQVDAAVIALKQSQIKDYDFWYRTVDIVQDYYDPETKAAITQSGLKAWLNRCKQAPREETPNAKSITRTVTPQNLILHNQEA